MIIKMIYMCKNTGYLVTFSRFSDIALFDKIGSVLREKKGNKVTTILHTYFIPLVMTPLQSPSVILTRLTKRKVEGGERQKK